MKAFIAFLLFLFLLASSQPVLGQGRPFADAVAAISADTFTVPAGQAEANSHRNLHVPMVAYLLAAGADTGTTMFALGRYPDRIIEGNRVMAPLAKHPVAFGIVEMAVPAVVYLLAQRHHGHTGKWERRLVKWGLYTGAGVHGWAAVRNVQLVRRTAAE